MKLPLHHFLHLQVHFSLKVLHVPHLHITFQFRQNNLLLLLWFPRSSENLGLDILLQLCFEVVIIFQLQLEVVTIVMLDCLG